MLADSRWAICLVLRLVWVVLGFYAVLTWREIINLTALDTFG